MNLVHLIIISWMISVGFPHAWGRPFHGESADLPMCFLQWNAFVKYMYVYFQYLFDLSNKQTSEIDIFFKKEIRSSVEEKITHTLCLCVFGGGGVNYIL